MQMWLLWNLSMLPYYYLQALIPHAQKEGRGERKRETAFITEAPWNTVVTCDSQIMQSNFELTQILVSFD